MMSHLFTLIILLLTVLLSACTNSSSDSNSIEIHTQGDLTDIVITNTDTDEFWVFDSYQSEPVALEIEEGARLTIEAKSDFHKCWFDGWVSELVLNTSSSIKVTCHKQPLFDVYSNNGPDLYQTNFYKFDGENLKTIKEKPSTGPWKTSSWFQTTKNFLFNLESTFFDGLEIDLNDVTEKTIDDVFFDPDIDKNTLFVVASEPGETSELFTLTADRSALKPVNLISDLNISDFVNNSYQNDAILNYHHSFDGINLTSSQSFEIPNFSSLTNIPYASETGLNRIKLMHRDDLFYWYAEDGPLMVRRVINENGTDSLVKHIPLPELVGISGIYQVNRFGEKIIVGFTYGNEQQCENYYEYELADNWRLIYNSCDQVNSSINLSVDETYGYLLVERNDGFNGWLVIDIKSGAEHGGIKLTGDLGRNLSGLKIYDDGIMITTSEASPDWCSQSQGCGFVNNVYFYSFKLNTLELLVSSDPAKFQPAMLGDKTYHSPLSAFLYETNAPLNLKYKNLKFFILYTAETGNEIWQTDGTVQGTKVIETFSPGSQHGIYYQDQSLVPILLD